MTYEQKSCSNCPKFQPHNDGTDKGWCTLFDRFAREHHTMTADCEQELEVTEDTQEAIELPAPIGRLPQLGDFKTIGAYCLMCTEVDTGDYAAVYEISRDFQPAGEVYMTYDGYWQHNLSEGLLDTPYQAVGDFDQHLSCPDLVAA
jgi:hypothetical protein